MKIWVGTDLHKHQMTVCIRKDDRKMPDIMTKYRTTEEGYKEFIGLLNDLSDYCPQDVRIAVESTGNTRYFKNRMEGAGFRVQVVNTMKFKVITESVNKTDRHDARTIAEFLGKGMLPEVQLCSSKSEELRNLLKHRSTLKQTVVKLKNQVHGVMLGLGIETRNGQLNSKKGREKTIEMITDSTKKRIVRGIIASIEEIEKQIAGIEEILRELTEEDESVRILQTIPGTGFITAVTARAYIDDIERFRSYQKLSAYAGLVPWVQQSDEKAYYGRITKHGPMELRTVFVQMAIGMMRVKKAKNNRYMTAYRMMKSRKGSGKAIVATARKLSKLAWYLLKNKEPFHPKKVEVILNEMEYSKFVA